MKIKFHSLFLLFGFVLLLSATVPGQRRTSKPQILRVCGDPTVRCITEAEFAPHQLPFAIKFKNGIIQEGEWFFAVVLKSIRVPEENCETFVSEKERLEAQKLFPHNKAFTDRCYDPGELFYEGFKPDARTLAVFGGRTRAEAEKILTQAKTKYPAAFIRRTRTGFNGT
jgi:hypothetical protein